MYFQQQGRFRKDCTEGSEVASPGSNNSFLLPLKTVLYIPFIYVKVGEASSKNHSSETKMRNGSDNNENIIQVQDSCLPITGNLHHLEIHRDLKCLLYHLWVFGYVLNIQE